MHPSDITIILPTRNEERNIGTFLASLPETCHLIVVDAGEDRTAEIVTDVRPERSLVVRRKSTIPEARQIGAELAKTEWLLFTDADVVFPPDYFQGLSRYAGFDSVYGGKLSRDRFRRYYRGFAFAQRVSHWIGIPAVSGSNLLVRRQVVLSVGGFDPELVCNEDSELGWRIKRAGYRIGFAPDLPVYATDHRRLERGVLRKTLHSVSRCFLLRFDLIPARWRRLDWGYWSKAEPTGNDVSQSE
jgi:cellulose synthase/poly-beta-1,6-N-acetylglucosamine synthase-like glycosyltransferase